MFLEIQQKIYKLLHSNCHLFAIQLGIWKSSISKTSWKKWTLFTFNNSLYVFVLFHGQTFKRFALVNKNGEMCAEHVDLRKSAIKIAKLCQVGFQYFNELNFYALDKKQFAKYTWNLGMGLWKFRKTDICFILEPLESNEKTKITKSTNYIETIAANGT